MKWLRYVSLFGLRSLLSKLLISYSIILIAVLAVGLVGLAKVGELIKLREQQATKAYLDRAFELVDAELDHLVNAAYGVLLTGENLRRLAQSETEVYARLELMRALSRFRSAFPLVSECYLSRAGQSFVISSEGTEPQRQSFHALLRPSEGALASVTNVRDTGRFRVLAVAERQAEASGAGDQDWLVLVARSGAQASAATLLVFVDEKNLRGILARTPASDYGRISVVDARGRLLSTSDGVGVGTTVDAGLRAAFERADAGPFSDHDRSLVVSRRSLFFDGFYFAEIPYATLFRPLAAVRAWFTFAGVCLVLLHVAVSIVFAVMIYNPVARLVDEVSDTAAGGAGAADELGAVKQAMQTIEARRRSLSERTAVEDLLELGDGGPAFRELMPFPLFKVAVVKAMDARHARRIAERFFAERGGPAERWACTANGRSGECIVLANGAAIDERRVRATFEELVAAAAEDCPLFVGLGRTLPGTAGVRESLRSALGALAQGRSGSNGSRGAVYEQESARGSGRLDFPTNMGSLLAAAIGGGRAARVEAVVDDLFSRNAGVPNLYLTMIGRELLSIYVRLGGAPGPKLEAASRVVDNDLCVERIERSFVDLFAGLIEREPSRDGRSRHVVELVTRLVEQQYMHPDLRGQSIADRVGLSPCHLSSVFKSTVGVGLADYLAAYRFERAKDLLLTTNKSVKEIGACVGFAVQNSFVRAFRKSVGASPGEYRRLKVPASGAAASDAKP